MLKQHWRIVSLIARVSDNCIIVLSFFLAHLWRDSFLLLLSRFVTTESLSPLGPLQDYGLVLAIALPLYNAMLSINGAYRSMRMSSVFSLMRLLLVTSSVVFLCVAALLFILKFELSRSFLGLFCVLCGCLLLVERIIVLRVLRYFRARGKNYRNVLIAGTGPQARRIYQEISQLPEMGIRVVGFALLASPSAEKDTSHLYESAGSNAGVRLKEEASAVFDLPARVVADSDSFEPVLKERSIDEVLFTDILSYYDQVQRLAEVAVEEGVTVTFAADLFSVGIVNSDVTYFGSVPLIHFEATPSSVKAVVVKRLLDVGIASVALVLSSPIMLVTALAIKLESKGPVFFRQKRVGLNGRAFTLLKFRSMVDNAEDMLASLEDQNEMKGPVFKLKKDPRVTQVGRFIRRYSIDELPQLFNVIWGDMSLVGPRPPIPQEVKQYKRKQRRRLSMRPGITCTWQVSGRNTIPDFEEWAQLDLEYIDNWSLRGDIALLLRTIPAVFRGTGH